MKQYTPPAPYKKDGKVYDRVTTVLASIAKPALYYYYARMAFEATHDLLDKTFEDVWSEVNRRQNTTKDRGSDVHDILEKYFSNNPYVIKEENGYHRAVKLFIEEEAKNFEASFLERTIWLDELEVAGRCDFYGTYKGKSAVVDFKTGLRAYPEYAIQLSAYKSALVKEGVAKNDTKLYNVVFMKDGKYQIVEQMDCVEVFHAVHVVYKFLKGYENK